MMYPWNTPESEPGYPRIVRTTGAEWRTTGSRNAGRTGERASMQADLRSPVSTDGRMDTHFDGMAHRLNGGLRDRRADRFTDGRNDT